MKTFFFVLALLITGVVACGQSASPPLPCAYSGALLRAKDGKVALFPSEEMKTRAIHKEDLGGIFKMVDGRAVVIADVIVSPKGNVVCTKARTDANGIFGGGVERALAKWKFSPAVKRGRPIAYLGRLEFTLCNTSCREGEWGMSILK